MSNKEPLIIYWAPFSSHEIEEAGNWNMLYTDPVSLFDEMIVHKTKESKNESIFSCPAVGGRFKNTFVFKNNLRTEIDYDCSDDKNIVNPKDVRQVAMRKIRPNAVDNGTSLVYAMRYFFFAEESVQATFNPPFFHKPGYMKYGSIVPGTFDIGQWFRSYNCEIQMWDTKGKFIMEDGEPLFYIEIPTDRKVIFKRFEFNPKLQSYAFSASMSPQHYGSNVPLVDRYKRFMQTRTNEIVLKEIKANLI